MIDVDIARRYLAETMPPDEVAISDTTILDLAAAVITTVPKKASA